MGITGLLPALKSITETKGLEEYCGKTLAIDGYCWLHRAIYSCSQEICLGQPTDKYALVFLLLLKTATVLLTLQWFALSRYVNYFMERVEILVRNGITPYVVFDGGPLPMKKGTEVERRAARQKNRELGIQCYKQRNYTEARKYFSRAADVSPFMAHRVIQRLKAQNVQYVVAPYEADAQLAFLTKNGLADGVITEDSDCLPFGCGTVLFKLDKDGVGVGQEIKASNLKNNKGLLFHMFTHEMFLEMCIFSGCDYLPSLPGFGLKKAYTALKQHGSFTKIIRALRLEGKVRIPPTYEAEFEKALLTFRHQRVYDPKTRQIVPLTPIPDRDLAVAEDAAMEFLGPMLHQDVAQAIAEGDMDPITMERFPAVATPPPAASSYNNGEKLAQARHVNIIANQLAVSRPPHAVAQRWQPSAQAHSRPFAGAMHQQGRKFPMSFATRVEATKFASQPSANAKPAASETSPHVISRYFAAQAKRASPLDETEKSLSSSLASSPSSSFESQEPLEVDIARSISFSPVKEEKQAHATTTNEKENLTPPRENVPPPAVKENAFSRMMKAGSLVQKQSLKRKATTSFHSRHGKQKPGLFAHQRTSVVQQMKQYIHVATSNSNSDSYSASSLSSSFGGGTNASNYREPPSTQGTNEPEVECDAAAEKPEAVVARGSYLSGVKQQAAKVCDDESNQHSSDVNKRPSTLLASLDRFRYKN